MAVGEWDHRELCSDGACTGVIGPSGTCKTCGRAAPNWGDERNRGLNTDAMDRDAPDDEREDDDADEDDDDAFEDDDEDPISPSAPAALGEAADWNARELCGDGACVGVIGSDGRCRTCGKPGRKRKAPAADDGELAAAASELARSADATAVDALAPAPALDDDDEYEDEDEDDEEYEDEDDGEHDADDAGDAEAAGGAREDADRRLCPDGACVGLIGDDGRCKVCGAEAG